MMGPGIAVVLLVYLVPMAVFFPVLYFVVRAAVRDALREHRAALALPAVRPPDGTA